MSNPMSLTYYPNDDERTEHMPPCIAMGDVVVCTFPVYASDDPEMPDAKRNQFGRLFAHSPRLLKAVRDHLTAMTRYNLDELFGHDEQYLASIEELAQVILEISPPEGTPV